MSNELTTTNGNTDLIQFDEGKVALIKKTIAPNATDDELELFLHQCRRTGLDPLAKQIYFQKYNTNSGPRVSIITGIDGYRVVADRTGVYAGSDDPVFEGRITQDRYRESKQVPAKASVTVWKIVAGKRVPFTASAYWEEYYPGDKMGHMWFKMPHVMLGKVAEAQALRKAFPADLSGVYTREEMDQANLDWQELDEDKKDGQPAKLVDTTTGEITEGGVVEFDDLASASDTAATNGNGTQDARAETSPQEQAKRKRPGQGTTPDGARQAAETKAALIAASQDGGDEPASDKQLTYVRSSMSKLVENDHDKAKLLLFHIYGLESSTELTKGQASALINWVGANADNGYTPTEQAQTEASRLLRAFQVEQGQQELGV